MSNNKQNKTGKSGNMSSKPSRNNVLSTVLTKNVSPGEFQTYTDGRIVKIEGVKNIAVGMDRKIFSSEKYKKSPEERTKLKKLKSNWKMHMKIQYGDSWYNTKNGNPSVKRDKVTNEFILN